MPFTLRLANQNKSFIVHDDETILDAALRQNFDLPHNCCDGICGSCEAQLVDGVVTYAETDHLIFDEEERASGKVLCCSAFAQSDLLMNAPEICFSNESILPPLQKYTLKTLKLIGIDVYQAYLEPQSKPLDYLAGQYVEVHLPNEEVNFFSVANAPNEKGLIELHIRCQKNNLYAKRLIDRLEKHKELEIRGPYGHCFYHPYPKMPSVMIAVGTGFAPIKAVLENIFSDAGSEEITLFWAGKSIHDLYQLRLVQEWAQQIKNFRFIPILSGEEIPKDWDGAVGDVLKVVCHYFPNLSQSHLYLGGPVQLTLDALEKLPLQGAQTCFMYSDAFDLKE